MGTLYWVRGKGLNSGYIFIIVFAISILFCSLHKQFPDPRTIPSRRKVSVSGGWVVGG